MGAVLEAYPWRSIEVVEEQDGMVYLLVRSCFENVPMRDERASYRLGILASG